MSEPPQRPVVGAGVVVRRMTADGPRVLLIKRAHPPKAGYWAIPGGKHELGETSREAARRELEEETGLTVGPLELVDIFDIIREEADGTISMHFTLVDYAADWIGGEAIASSDAADLVWADPGKLDAYELSTAESYDLIARAFENWSGSASGPDTEGGDEAP